MKMRVEIVGPIRQGEEFTVGPDGRCFRFKPGLPVGVALESTEGGVIDADVFTRGGMIDSYECATAAQDIEPGDMVTGDMLRSEPKPTLAEAEEPEPSRSHWGATLAQQTWIAEQPDKPFHVGPEILKRGAP